VVVGWTFSHPLLGSNDITSNDRKQNVYLNHLQILKLHFRRQEIEEKKRKKSLIFLQAFSTRNHNFQHEGGTIILILGTMSVILDIIKISGGQNFSKNNIFLRDND
jgi:hypothetical protein